MPATGCARHVHHGRARHPRGWLSSAAGCGRCASSGRCWPAPATGSSCARSRPPDTLGGGVVLDPAARRHGRRDDVLARLERLRRGEPEPAPEAGSGAGAARAAGPAPAAARVGPRARGAPARGRPRAAQRSRPRGRGPRRTARRRARRARRAADVRAPRRAGAVRARVEAVVAAEGAITLARLRDELGPRASSPKPTSSTSTPSGSPSACPTTRASCAAIKKLGATPTIRGWERYAPRCRPAQGPDPAARGVGAPPCLDAAARVGARRRPLRVGPARRPSRVACGVDAGPIALCAGVASRPRVSRRNRAVAVCVGLLTSSAVVVHLMNGAIEGHFHFFVMVSVLALYEDWFPYLLAFAFVLGHHGLMGVLEPASVYNHPDAVAHPWRWAGIHALFIGALGVVNVVHWRLNEEARADAMHSRERFRHAFDDAPSAWPSPVSTAWSCAPTPRSASARGRPAGRPLADLVDAEDLGGRPFPADGGEIEVRYADTGAWGLWHDSLLTGRDGRPEAWISHCIDVSKRRFAEDELSWQANHDSLTGLPNRELFLERLSGALARRGGQVARAVPRPRRLQGRQRLARPRRRRSPAQRRGRAPAPRAAPERRHRPLRRRRVHGPAAGHRRARTTRCGVAEPPGRGPARAARPRRRASATSAPASASSFSAAGGTTPRRCCATPTRPCTAPRRWARRATRSSTSRCASARWSGCELESDLRHALERGELRARLPADRRRSTDGRVSGVEALLRWDHPICGARRAVHFIPMAERRRADHPASARGCCARPAASCAEWARRRRSAWRSTCRRASSADRSGRGRRARRSTRLGIDAGLPVPGDHRERR